VNNTPPLPPIIPTSSPILDSVDSLSTTPPTPLHQQPINNHGSSSSLPTTSNPSRSVTLGDIELLSMTITLSDPQKHQDTQGAFVTYLVTTKVRPSDDSLGYSTYIMIDSSRNFQIRHA
jgi:hypothetical protein